MRVDLSHILQIQFLQVASKEGIEAMGTHDQLAQLEG